MTDTLAHIDAVRRVAAGAAPVDDVIRRSWHRCVHTHGLVPERSGDVRVETAARLQESRERIEEYLQVARAGMEQLFKRVSSIGYVLMLTDGDGITVDYIGNDSWGLDARQAGLHLGSNWQEEIAGTNGIGTCIVERAPLTCHRDDHFFVGHLGLSCNTAPLLHPEGGLMGVLDVSALTRPGAQESQHLALHLTTMYGQMIEDANFVRHYRDHWILRLAPGWALVDVFGEMMLAFDADGVVVGANSGARRQMAAFATEGTPRPRLLTELFACTMDEIWRLKRPSHALDRALLTTHDNRVYYGTVVAPRVASSAVVASHGREATAVALRPAQATALDAMAGDDERMRTLVDQARRLADKRVSILIQGETGSGKEVFAKAIHESSNRVARPFVAVNCAAIPESLIESELFGYAPGTFTGARSRGMKGLILQSHGGTLFLDEIGDMPLHLQTRLLRVLSEHEVAALGADRPVHVDLTVIAASHRDLRKLIAVGAFREDLYYRLCGATLALPALRERRDLRFLIERLLHEEARPLAVEPRISEAALQRLLRHDWPGNVRELRNALRFGLAVSDGDGIGVEHLPAGLGVIAHEPARLAGPVPASAPELDPETAALLALLRRHRWNITGVAAETGTCRTTIYRRMRKLGIVSPTQLDGAD